MKKIITVPNVLSLLRIILTPIFIILYVMCGGAYQLPAVVLFTLAMATDTCDGYYARRYGVQTKLGAFLDPIADKILVIATFSLFVWQGLLHWIIVMLMMVRDVVVTGLRLKLVTQGTSLKTSQLGKGKTAVQFVSIYLFFIVNWMDGSSWAIAKESALLCAQVVILVVVLLSLYSGLDYVMRYWRHTSKKIEDKYE